MLCKKQIYVYLLERKLDSLLLRAKEVFIICLLCWRCALHHELQQQVKQIINICLRYISPTRWFCFKGCRETEGQLCYFLKAFITPDFVAAAYNCPLLNYSTLSTLTSIMRLRERSKACLLAAASCYLKDSTQASWCIDQIKREAAVSGDSLQNFFPSVFIRSITSLFS